MKKCNICNELLHNTCFSRDKTTKDGLQRKCKPCQKNLSNKHYKNNKQKYADNLKKRRFKVRSVIKCLKETTPCTDCKIQYPFYVMQFDHLRDKEFGISHAVKEQTLSRILNEIEKCEIVCANCHAKRSYQRILQNT